MPSLRLVTLNTWKGDGAYGARLAAMAAGLTALNPDVIVLQEVLATPDAAYDTATYLGQKLDTAISTLPLRRKIRDVEGRSVDSTSGLAVLSRLPIGSSRSVSLTSDKRDGERAVLMVDLGVLTVACLHLTHLRKAGDLRRRQWREVVAALGDCPVAVAAGDFNTPVEKLELAGGRFADSREACGEPARSTLIADATACIDHVLFSGLAPTRWQTALGDADAGGINPSDHRAVVVDFLLR